MQRYGRLPKIVEGKGRVGGTFNVHTFPRSNASSDGQNQLAEDLAGGEQAVGR